MAKTEPGYELVPSAYEDERDALLDAEDSDEEETELTEFAQAAARENSRLHNELMADERFHPPTPSPYKRGLLIFFLIGITLLAIKLRSSVIEAIIEPEIIHAKRYSKEHRYRPAASPIITQTLKDGRIKLFGAGATSSSAPVATPVKRQTKTKRKAKKPVKKAKKLGPLKRK